MLVEEGLCRREEGLATGTGISDVAGGDAEDRLSCPAEVFTAPPEFQRRSHGGALGKADPLLPAHLPRVTSGEPVQPAHLI